MATRNGSSGHSRAAAHEFAAVRECTESRKLNNLDNLEQSQSQRREESEKPQPY